MAGQADQPTPFPSDQDGQIAWLTTWSRTGVGHAGWLDKQMAIVPFLGPHVRFTSRYWFDRSPLDERALLAVIMSGRHNRYTVPPPKAKKGEAPALAEVIKPGPENASEDTRFTAEPRLSLAMNDGGRVAWVVHLVAPAAQTITVTAIPPAGKHELLWTLDGQPLPAAKLVAGLAVPVRPGLHALVGFATFREQRPEVPFSAGLSVAGTDLWQMLHTGMQLATYEKYKRIREKDGR